MDAAPSGLSLAAFLTAGLGGGFRAIGL